MSKVIAFAEVDENDVPDVIEFPYDEYDYDYAEYDDSADDYEYDYEDYAAEADARADFEAFGQWER